MWAKYKGWIIGVCVIVVFLIVGIIAGTNIDAKLAESRVISANALRNSLEATDRLDRAEESGRQSLVLIQSALRRLDESDAQTRQLRFDIDEARSQLRDAKNRLDEIRDALGRLPSIAQRNEADNSALVRGIEDLARQLGINIHKPTD